LRADVRLKLAGNVVSKSVRWAMRNSEGGGRFGSLGCHFGPGPWGYVPFWQLLCTTRVNDGSSPPNKMAALNSKKRPDSDRVFALRRYLIGFLFVVIFVLLDRKTVYLQILPGISAWYPPAGIALTLLIGMGTRYAPLYWLAGLIAAKVTM
jgi:hypothetical protein